MTDPKTTFVIRWAGYAFLLAALVLLASSLYGQSMPLAFPSTPCRSAAISGMRGMSDDPANYNNLSINRLLKSPDPRLIMVTAHRGYWEYCPENTIPAFQWALDLGAEIVEMDIRISAPGWGKSIYTRPSTQPSEEWFPNGEIYLTHDYDLRGEVPLQKPGSNGNNLIYNLNPASLSGTPRQMVNRYGYPAVDSDGKPITFSPLQDLLLSYVSRFQGLNSASGRVDLTCIDHSTSSGGIVTKSALKITRGSVIVLDIKGDDEDPGVLPNGSTQFQALLEAFKEVHEFECEHGVDLRSAIAMKLSGNKMFTDAKSGVPNFIDAYGLDQRLASYLSDGPAFPLQDLPYYGLIFIVYPNDVPEGVPAQAAQTDKDKAAAFINWLPSFEAGYPAYLLGDWQYRWPGSALQGYVASHLKAGKGVANFVPTNAYTEGYRQSDGVCCGGGQALQGFYSASVDFLVPSSNLGTSTETGAEYRATAITTDIFPIVERYLTRMNYRDTSLIK